MFDPLLLVGGGGDDDGVDEMMVVVDPVVPAVPVTAFGHSFRTLSKLLPSSQS